MKKELIILYLIIFISGCSQINKEFPSSYERMDYSIGLPDEVNGIDYVDFVFEGNNILLDQRLNYDCCASLSLNYKVDNGILRIYEYNNNKTLCGNICTFVIKAKIKERNIEEVELYGVGYEDWPYPFISEKKR